MIYKEVKDLLHKLNCENIEEFKPVLNRTVNQLILSIYDKDNSLSNEELESLCETLLLREEFRYENNMNEGVLVEEFIGIYNQFINSIVDKGNIIDAIELTTLSLRSIGGLSRVIMSVMKNKEKGSYIRSSQHLQDLVNAFFSHLKLYAYKGIYEEQFIIMGLIHFIRFELEEKCQEHGRSLLSLLTDRKNKRLKTLEEFNSESHIGELNCLTNREYAIELQRRLYSWDKLTVDLKDHYYLESLYCDK